MKKVKIGTKVKLIHDYFVTKKGWTGVVSKLSYNETCASVKWDNLNGRLETVDSIHLVPCDGSFISYKPTNCPEDV